MAFFSKLFGRHPKQAPIVLHDALGTFTLDRSKCRMFEGSIDWCGERCHVYLDPDAPDAATANAALSVLHRLLPDAAAWDQRLKAYSAAQKAEADGLVHIWGSPDQLGEDVPPITKETYISRMSLGFLHIMTEGELYFDFNLDDMFTDHGEGVDAHIDGTIHSAGLQG